MARMLGWMRQFHRPASDDLRSRPVARQEMKRIRQRPAFGHAQIDGQRVRGYADELGHASNTETFVALRCELDNWRWAGVPIYLRTGKRMAQRYSEIVVTFKPVPHSIFGGGSCDRLDANRLFIRLQPNDGVQLQLMMKSVLYKQLIFILSSINISDTIRRMQ